MKSDLGTYLGTCFMSISLRSKPEILLVFERTAIFVAAAAKRHLGKLLLQTISGLPSKH